MTKTQYSPKIDAVLARCSDFTEADFAALAEAAADQAGESNPLHTFVLEKVRDERDRAWDRHHALEIVVASACRRIAELEAALVEACNAALDWIPDDNDPLLGAAASRLSERIAALRALAKGDQ